jgi:DNA repair exonuclease SbcCD ATPase subunit
MRKAKNNDPGGVKFTLCQKIKKLEEQLAQALEGRRQALAQAEDYLERLAKAASHINNMEGALAELRKSLDDMRRQRDRAQGEEERERERRTIAHKNFYRAMGWIDAKMDKPPLLEDFGEIPF